MCSWRMAGIPKHSCTGGKMQGWLSTCTVWLLQGLAEVGGRAAGSTDPPPTTALPSFPLLKGREQKWLSGNQGTVAGNCFPTD